MSLHFYVGLYVKILLLQTSSDAVEFDTFIAQRFVVRPTNNN